MQGIETSFLIKRHYINGGMSETQYINGEKVKTLIFEDKNNDNKYDTSELITEVAHLSEEKTKDLEAQKNYAQVLKQKIVEIFTKVDGNKRVDTKYEDGKLVEETNYIDKNGDGNFTDEELSSKKTFQ